MSNPHAEVSHYVPHPTIVLMGCQAWPPAPNPDGSCGVCGGGVHPKHHTTYCAACDALSARNEARVRAQLAGVKGLTEQEHAERTARKSLSDQSRGGLTESDKRRLWNGYRGGLRAENPEPTNRAKVARDWLTARGLAPDWNLILDARGNTVGRHSAEVA